jgi:hypothetical protein
MKIFTKFFIFLFGLAAVLFLAGCSSTGDGRSSVTYHQTVYGGYGYPYSYGCCYDNGSDVIVVKPERPDRPDRPVRPRPPSIQPVRPSRPIGRPAGSRPSVGMGRPSRPRVSRRR